MGEERWNLDGALVWRFSFGFPRPKPRPLFVRFSRVDENGVTRFRMGDVIWEIRVRAGEAES
jgi:cold shock CspA family protein